MRIRREPLRCATLARLAAVRAAVFASILTFAAAHAGEPRGVVWRGDLAQARAESVELDKPVWIQFTGPWCHFCHKMDREVFSEESIGATARESFIAVKLRADENEQLALAYGFSALPASLILNPRGEVVTLRQGFADALEFRGFLDDALKRMGRGPAAGLVRTSTVRTRVALNGFCPVTLVEARKLARGQAEIREIHDGIEYRFATAAARTRFLLAPERYEPQNAGFSPVRQVDAGESKAGNARWGVIYAGHLYLCADGDERARFLSNPSRYARVGATDRANCPHCWGRDRLVARPSRRSLLNDAATRITSPLVDLFASIRDTATLRR